MSTRSAQHNNRIGLRRSLIVLIGVHGYFRHLSLEQMLPYASRLDVLAMLYFGPHMALLLQALLMELDHISMAALMSIFLLLSSVSARQVANLRRVLRDFPNKGLTHMSRYRSRVPLEMTRMCSGRGLSLYIFNLTPPTLSEGHTQRLVGLPTCKG